MDRFRLMESFVTVVRLGSFTQAAKELGITRAMASKRVQLLEAELGVRLLNRNTHGLSTTGAGAEYFERAANLLAEVAELDARMQSVASEPAGELRILSSKTFGETILAPVVSDFCRAYPQVAVHLTLRDRESMPHGLDPVGGGFDMAIRTLPTRNSALLARAIFDLPRVVVAAPDYLARHGEPRRPGDLTAHNCLDPCGASHYTWVFRGRDGRESVRVGGTPSANNSAVIRHAALRGQGIAMLGEYLVSEHLGDGTLVPLLRDHALDPRKLYVVFQRDRYRSVRTRAFIDFLTASLRGRGRPAAASEDTAA